MTMPASVSDPRPSSAAARTAASANGTTRSIMRGLIWRERQLHGSLVDAYVAIWVIGIWALRLIDHPAVLALFGFLLAAQLGSRLGSSEWKEGAEEFLFALPPTRRQRFWIRGAAGLVPVVLLTGLGAAALAWNRPAELWSLFSDGPFCEPTPPQAVSTWLAVFALSIAIYAISYSVHAALPRKGGQSAIVVVTMVLVLSLPVLVHIGTTGELLAEMHLHVDITRLLVALIVTVLVPLIAVQRFARRAPAALS